MSLRSLIALFGIVGLVGCGQGGADFESRRSAVAMPIAEPAMVFEGPVYCQEAATALGLEGTFEAPSLIDTYPTPPAGPVDIGNGQTATLTFFGGELKLFSWEATTPITIVLVYGRESERENAFLYDPASLGDGLLGAPDDSNVDFVKLCYLLPEGCTLTQGYWKTHSSAGPAPYDATWEKIGDVSTFFLSGKSYYQVLWTPPAGNAYYILAHQYIAAKLNVAAGASLGDLADEYAAATTLLQTYAPAAVAGNKALKAQFTSLAGSLAAFNEGTFGPGHCDEREPSTN